MVGVHSPATRALVPLEFTIDGVVRNVNLPAPVAKTAYGVKAEVVSQIEV